MAPAQSELTIVVKLRDQISKSLGQVQQGFRSFGSSASGALTSFGGVVAGFLSGPFGAFLSALSIQSLVSRFSSAIGDMAKEIIQLGIEVERTERRFRNEFGPAADDVRGKIVALAQELGKSDNDLAEFALVFSRVTKEIGLTDAQAASFSTQLTELTLNLAAANGAADADAFNAVRSALLGSTRGLREFNIALTEDEIAQEAVRLGAAETTEGLNDQQKAVGRLSAILTALGKNTGAAAEVSKTFEGQIGRINAQIKDFKEALGVEFTQALSDLIDFLGGAERAAHLMVVAFRAVGSVIRDVVSAARELVSVLPVVRVFFQDTGGDTAPDRSRFAATEERIRALVEAKKASEELAVAAAAASTSIEQIGETIVTATKIDPLFDSFREAADFFGKDLARSFEEQRFEIAATTEERRRSITVITQQLELSQREATLLRELSDLENTRQLELVRAAEQKIQVDAQNAVSKLFEEVERARIARIIQQNQTVLQGLAAFGSAFENALTSIATGAQNAKEAFKDFGRSILSDIARLIARGLALRAVFAIGGGLFGIPDSALTGFFGSEKGNAFSGGNVIPFQRGGAFTNSVVSRPTVAPLALFGEKEPEAILPLSRGPGGRLGVSSSGGGSTNVQVSFNVAAVDARSVAELFASNGDALANVLANVMMSSPSTRAAILGTGR